MLTKNQINAIIAARLRGMSIRKIAVAVGCSRPTVAKYLRKAWGPYAATSSVPAKHVRGFAVKDPKKRREIESANGAPTSLEVRALSNGPGPAAAAGREDGESRTLQLITAKDFAARVGLSVRTLQRMARASEGPTPVKISDHRVGYYEHEVSEWLANLPRTRA